MSVLKFSALLFVLAAAFAFEGMAVGDLEEKNFGAQKRKISNTFPWVKSRKIESHMEVYPDRVTPPSSLSNEIYNFYGIDILKYLATMDRCYGMWIKFIENGSQVNKEARWLKFFGKEIFSNLNLGFKYALIKGADIESKTKHQQLKILYHSFDKCHKLDPSLEKMLAHMACDIIDLQWKTEVDRTEILEFLIITRPMILKCLPQESVKLKSVAKTICMNIAEKGRCSRIINYIMQNPDEMVNVVNDIVISLRVKKKDILALKFLEVVRPYLLYFFPEEREFATVRFNILAMKLANENNFEPVLAYLKAHKDEKLLKELQDKLSEYVLKKATH